MLDDIGGPRGLIITLQALSLSRMFTLPKQNMTHIDIELHFRKLDGDIIYFDRRQKRGDIDIIVVHFLFCKVIVTWEKLGSCWGSVSLERKYILSNTILFIYIFLWSREKIHIFFLSAYCRLIWGLLEQMVPLVCALRSPNICHRFGIHKGIMLKTSIIFSGKHFWFQYSILILIKISDVNIAELILVNSISFSPLFFLNVLETYLCSSMRG